MPNPFSNVMRDYLVRFQQTALRETGRRPLTYKRTPMDEQLVLPGCRRPGYVFWQPVAWQDGKTPLGKNAKLFHETILEYVSVCQFLEMRFRLPVAPMNSPLSFAYDRVFETYKNTVTAPPSRAFDEAVLYHEQHPEEPLSYCMAATCDGGAPVRILLAAGDGQMLVARTEEEGAPVSCRLTVDRLLPKLQFVYEF